MSEGNDFLEGQEKWIPFEDRIKENLLSYDEVETASVEADFADLTVFQRFHVIINGVDLGEIQIPKWLMGNKTKNYNPLSLSGYEALAGLDHMACAAQDIMDIYRKKKGERV